MVDRRAAARAIEEFLRALGHEPTGDLAETGQRVADAWADDLLSGYAVDAASLLRAGAIDVVQGQSGLVLIRDMAITTVCPHHLLPAYGTGTVAYLPQSRLAGIGTIAQVLDALARRLSLQEQVGAETAELIVRELGARGALCRLVLTHTCLVSRGERQARAVVETVATAGTFAEPTADRDLVWAALGAPGSRP